MVHQVQSRPDSEDESTENKTETRAPDFRLPPPQGPGPEAKAEAVLPEGGKAEAVLPEDGQSWLYVRLAIIFACHATKHVLLSVLGAAHGEISTDDVAQWSFIGMLVTPLLIASFARLYPEEGAKAPIASGGQEVPMGKTMLDGREVSGELVPLTAMWRWIVRAELVITQTFAITCLIWCRDFLTPVVAVALTGLSPMVVYFAQYVFARVHPTRRIRLPGTGEEADVLQPGATASLSRTSVFGMAMCVVGTFLVAFAEQQASAGGYSAPTWGETIIGTVITLVGFFAFGWRYSLHRLADKNTEAWDLTTMYLGTLLFDYLVVRPVCEASNGLAVHPYPDDTINYDGLSLLQVTSRVLGGLRRVQGGPGGTASSHGFFPFYLHELETNTAGLVRRLVRMQNTVEISIYVAVVSFNQAFLAALSIWIATRDSVKHKKFAPLVFSILCMIDIVAGAPCILLEWLMYYFFRATPQHEVNYIRLIGEPFTGFSVLSLCGYLITIAATGVFLFQDYLLPKEESLGVDDRDSLYAAMLQSEEDFQNKQKKKAAMGEEDEH